MGKYSMGAASRKILEDRDSILLQPGGANPPKPEQMPDDKEWGPYPWKELLVVKGTKYVEGDQNLDPPKSDRWQLTFAIPTDAISPNKGRVWPVSFFTNPPMRTKKGDIQFDDDTVRDLAKLSKLFKAAKVKVALDDKGEEDMELSFVAEEGKPGCLVNARVIATIERGTYKSGPRARTPGKMNPYCRIRSWDPADA